VRGGEHLPAPAPKEQMQGVRGGEHLPAPAPKEHMQGVRGDGRASICQHQRERSRCKECGISREFPWNGWSPGVSSYVRRPFPSKEVRRSGWDPETSGKRIGDWGGPETVWALLCVAARLATLVQLTTTH
jgi:hypothetical protein